MSTENALLREVLRDVANGVERTNAGRAYAIVAKAVSLKLDGMSELDRARLLRQHATDPARLVDLNRLARAAGWPVLGEVIA